MMYPRIDLREIAAQLDVDLNAALAALELIYAAVDLRNEENTKGLDLPCHRGCDMCCHESVFLTPLEFLGAWNYIQRELDDEARNDIVDRGLALYTEHWDLILALDEPPPEGSRDHLAIARQLKFTCPVLGKSGECRAYPMRELYARLFGCSFNDDGGVYGCHLVGTHLAGREITLLSVRPTARRLDELSLTFKRQVYPSYIHMLYG